MPACHAGGRRFEPDPGRHVLLVLSRASGCEEQRRRSRKRQAIRAGFFVIYKAHRSKRERGVLKVRERAVVRSNAVDRKKDKRYGGYSQVVKTHGCGPCIRGFESHYPPQAIQRAAANAKTLGRSQVVRQRILIPSCAGSNPAALASYAVCFISDLYYNGYASAAYSRYASERLRGATQ